MVSLRGRAFLAIALVFPAESYAGEAGEQEAADLVIDRFPIVKGSFAILVPVRLGAKQYNFILAPARALHVSTYTCPSGSE